MYLYFITETLSLKLKDQKGMRGWDCPKQKLITLNCYLYMPFCQHYMQNRTHFFTSTIDDKLHSISTVAKNITAKQLTLQSTFLSLCSEMTQNHRLKSIFERKKIFMTSMLPPHLINTAPSAAKTFYAFNSPMCS